VDNLVKLPNVNTLQVVDILAQQEGSSRHIPLVMSGWSPGQTISGIVRLVFMAESQSGWHFHDAIYNRKVW